MAILAIKGKEYDNEVIEIFEMLGGRNTNEYNGYSESLYYYIDEDGSIECDKDEEIPFPCIYFTLEEFIEKYPYKVGDKVIIKSKNQEATVDGVVWCCNTITYWLNYNGFIEGNWRADRLQPYKEEAMGKTIKTITIDDFKANTKEWMIDTLESMPKDDALRTICELHNELHKLQYPKTYKECCKVMNIIPGNVLLFNNPNEESDYVYDNQGLYNTLDKLKVCRDAYWKLYGEQMGLGKPWEPDWENVRYSIYRYKNNEIIKGLDVARCIDRHILEFPTEEMRDAFFENYGELIEECKELL